MAHLEKPIRMCIVCKVRKNQKELLRLQCNEDKKLVPFGNNGRSFYICKECVNSVFHNDKTLKKIETSFFRVCKNKDNYIVQLKEILANVR